MIARVLDAILILVVIEAGGLAFWRVRTGAGIALRHLLPNLAAGFCLMLGIRVALGSGAQIGPAEAAGLGAILFAALVAHLLDLASRWRQ